jgi:hypothetical protein
MGGVLLDTYVINDLINDPAQLSGVAYVGAPPEVEFTTGYSGTLAVLETWLCGGQEVERELTTRPAGTVVVTRHDGDGNRYELDLRLDGPGPMARVTGHLEASAVVECRASEGGGGGGDDWDD